MKLKLSADALMFNIHCYIDGSHQIHDDCRGQVGYLVTFGHGAVTSSSNKIKSNTKSSTETELYALADKLGEVLWIRHFVYCQGYDIDECVIFQDNMSALSMEKNGRMSCSKRTKHIKAKYFLIKDYYNSGEIVLKYCPTDEMWAYVLTKPLQGQKFRDMRSFLQNCEWDYDDDTERTADARPMKQQINTVASSPECVGEHTNPPENPPRIQRSRSPTCGSQFLVTNKNPKKESPLDLQELQDHRILMTWYSDWDWKPTTQTGKMIDHKLNNYLGTQCHSGAHD